MSVKSLRTIAVGDVHGELDALKEILQHASMTDGNNHWAAGTDTLVQMGDVIDRGPRSRSSRTIFWGDFNERLPKPAVALSGSWATTNWPFSPAMSTGRTSRTRNRWEGS